MTRGSCKLTSVGMTDGESQAHLTFAKGVAEVKRAIAMARGRPVEYQVVGAGPPVVLLHGLSGSVRWWSRNIAALAAHHTVYLVNLPGFGTFWRRSRWIGLQEAAGWLADWLDAVKIGPCDMVAHSMGGFLTLRLVPPSMGPVMRGELPNSRLLMLPGGRPCGPVRPPPPVQRGGAGVPGG